MKNQSILDEKRRPRVKRIIKRNDIHMLMKLLTALCLLVIPMSWSILDILLIACLSLNVTNVIFAWISGMKQKIAVLVKTDRIVGFVRFVVTILSARLVIWLGSIGKVYELIFGLKCDPIKMELGVAILLTLMTMNVVYSCQIARFTSEIVAKYILNIMPKRQMDIDAKINNEVINDKQAKEERNTINKVAFEVFSI